jgi:NAD-dependent deacetylase
VWFGEYVPAMEVAEEHVREADIFAVIGTSLTVYPAAGLTRYAHGSVPKYVVDPNLTVIPTGFTHIKNNATCGVAQLVEEIKKL